MTTISDFKVKPTVFSGQTADYASWRRKFLSYLRLKNKSHLIDVDTQRDFLLLHPHATEDETTKWSNLSLELYDVLTNLVDSKTEKSLAANAYLDGKAAWNYLQNQHKSSLPIRAVALKQQLNAAKMNKHQDPLTFVTYIKTLTTDLCDLGDPISDKSLETEIIAKLPDNYSEFITSYLLRPDDQRSLDQLTELLSQKWNMDQIRLRVQKKMDVALTPAFQTTSLPRNNLVSPHKFKLRCFKCGSFDHIASKCSSPSSNWVGKDDYIKSWKQQRKRRERHSSSSQLASSSSHRPDVKGDSECNTTHLQMYSDSSSHAFVTTLSGPSFALSNIATTLDISSWIIDSGCSNHMSPYQHIFADLKMFQSKRQRDYVKMANGTSLPILGIGSVSCFAVDSNHIQHPVTLNNVLFVPGLQNNLFSTRQSSLKGHTILLAANTSKLIISEGLSFPFIFDSKWNLYTFHLQLSDKIVKADTALIASDAKSDSFLWHRRLGHPGSYPLSKLASNLKLQNSKSLNHPEDCDICITTKLPRPTFTSAPKEFKATRPCELVSADLTGPFRQPGINGEHYAIAFKDQYSHLGYVDFLSKKSEALTAIKVFIQKCGKPEIFRTDRGGEFLSNEAEKFFRKHGVKRQLTCPRSSQQNGEVERYWRTLFQITRANLAESHLPKKFWPYAMSYAVFQYNRRPHRSLENNLCPLQAFNSPSLLLDLTNLKVFGCLTYVYQIPTYRSDPKLSPSSMKGIFLGIPYGTKGYIIFLPQDNKTVITRDVRFNEDVPGGLLLDEHNVPAMTPEKAGLDIIPVDADRSPSSNPWVETPSSISPEPSDGVPFDTTVPIITPPSSTVRRSTRLRREPPYLKDYVQPNSQNPLLLETELSSCEAESPAPDSLSPPGHTHTCQLSIDESKYTSEPDTYQQAIQCPQASKWEQAMEEELSALHENETWTLCPRPPNRNIIGTRWIYKVKRNSDGSVDRFKARLVARGFTEVYGLDYDEVFSTVVRIGTVRTLFAIAVQDDLHLIQLDVKNAYLKAPVSEELYAEIPPGMKNLPVAVSSKTHCLKLLKSLYGLKQAGRNWNLLLTKWLVEDQHFVQAMSDTCLFIRINKKTKSVFIIVTYVDDLIGATSNPDEEKQFLEAFLSKFSLSRHDVLNWYVGMKIVQTKDRIDVEQPQYVTDMLHKFRMIDANPSSTPASLQRLSKPDDNSFPGELPYRSLVGSLLYIAKCSRPDINFAVHQLTKFGNCYSQEHWTAAKRVLRYLKQTKDEALSFCKVPDTTGQLKLVGYTDSDWAMDLDDRKSTGAYVFFLFNTPITWTTKKQPVVALSSTEAEYIALVEAAKEAIFLRQLLQDMGRTVQTPISILCDNKSTIALSKNPIAHGRSKHMDIKLHFIREVVNQGIIQVEYIPTKENIADALTKSLPVPTHARFTKYLLGKGQVGIEGSC